ncbi:DUF1801 domain-containing protein [Flaviramulus sp. BrNp1-15]|uniref:DUF1801 domain-containing protein n=1 Tax=Flaviramulus sp. BrNp1-15 TaxID=2916754 RepID=UPI001EE819A1|nr:DUF1801 domain-containing protein [Flaviramulus sp. BrNp1-15]ULC57863.1 DUF1801 domain-containing protein [Flaviramulus sp. BrNp1-15]
MDENVTKYIEKQKSLQKEICKKIRLLIFKTLPDIKEEMKWGVPAYGGGKCYFVSLKDHVNLGFSLKELSTEEIALLEGSGKTMKHIKMYSLEDIDEKRITDLILMVNNKTKVI